MNTVRWKARLLSAARRGARGLRRLLGCTGLTRIGAIQSLARAGKQRLMRWLESDNLLLVEANGHPMYIFNRPHFLAVYLGQSYEPYTLQLFQEAVKPGATVLDIGANIGYFSLAAAERVGAEGRVYAFEPGRDNFKVLKRNIEINNFENITAVPKAVGSESKTVTLTLAEDPDQHSLFKPPMVGAKGRITVECVALDDFMVGETIDVVKMDVEGNELGALDGMRQIIAKSNALVMVVELNPVCLHEANVEPAMLVSRLRGLGFELRVIDEDAHARILLTNDYLSQILSAPPGSFVNLYCTKGL